MDADAYLSGDARRELIVLRSQAGSVWPTNAEPRIASPDAFHGSSLPRVASMQWLSRDRRLGYGLWFLLFVVASTLVALGSKHSVTPSYWRAAENWLAGRPLYDGTGRGFIYLPQSAVLFVPFAMLPPLFREILWRFVTIGFFAWGLERLAATTQQRIPKPLFSIATAITLLISFTCAATGRPRC